MDNSGPQLKLNPNYTPVTNFLRLIRDGDNPHHEKLERLACDIGNCLWKVRHKPQKSVMRRLKKFFLKSKWFKKVRIIKSRLYLFRRKGRFAIILGQTQLHGLKLFAQQMRQARAQ